MTDISDEAARAALAEFEAEKQRAKQRGRMRQRSRARRKQFEELLEGADDIVLPAVKEHTDGRKKRQPSTKTESWCPGCKNLVANGGFDFSVRRSDGKKYRRHLCRHCWAERHRYNPRVGAVRAREYRAKKKAEREAR